MKRLLITVSIYRISKIRSLCENFERTVMASRGFGVVLVLLSINLELMVHLL
jgi:hypothetical protein